MSTARSALAWFAASSALYALGAAPGPLWADSSKLTLYALHEYLPSLSPGDHAGWTALAKLWLALVPWWEPPRSLHMLSAFAAGVAVSLVFLAVQSRSGSPAHAHSAAAVLMVSHSHWWSAEVAESYAAAAVWVLLTALASRHDHRRVGALAAGGAAGLAAATHALSAFVTIPLLVPHRRQRWLTVLFGLAAGTAPLWLAAFGSPDDPLTGHHPSRAGNWLWHAKAFVDPERMFGGLGLIALLLALGLGPFGLFAVARQPGWRPARSVHPRPVLAAGALVALILVLSGYLAARLHLMVGFITLGILLAAPLQLTLRQRIVHVLLQTALYTVLPAALCLLGHQSLGVRKLPNRNNAWYFLCPVKTVETGPHTYARALLAAAPANAVVLADFNPGAVLRLVQDLEDVRRDVVIVPTAVDEIQARFDPAGALLERIRGFASKDRPIVLADSWEPYYRITELRRRFGVAVRPCGPGLAVQIAPTGVSPPP